MNSEVYKKAEAFLPWNLHRHIYNSTIFPYWGKESLYYFQGSTSGYHLVEVNTKTGHKKTLFGLSIIAKSLSEQLGLSIQEDQLPLQGFNFDVDNNALSLNYMGFHWNFQLNGVCTKKEKEDKSGLLSPNQSWLLKIEDHNLTLINAKHQTSEKLTHDGLPYYDYAASPETNTRAISDRLALNIQAPIAVWSKDSTKFITHRLDQRNVKKLYLLQNAPEGKQRPELHEYRMSFSGDEHLPTAELVIFDVVNKTVTPVKSDALLAPYLTPIEFDWVWWDDAGKKVYYLEETRGSKSLSLCVADAETGVVQVLISEATETYLEPSQFFLWKPQVLVLQEKNAIIWMSKKDGYPHLYYYSIGKNTADYAITQGAWGVRELYFYDMHTDWLYFSAAGCVAGNDPYYRQLFRSHLDGSGMMCLTPEMGDHFILISPNKDCFLDTYSTINTAPTTQLRKLDGSLICHIESADIEHLHAMKWVPPVRFSEKGRDGKTAIYGNMYFPSNFDPDKKYPLIDHIYPGPQVYRTVPHFSLHNAIFRSPWLAQALAELGFIVIHVDGMGTPGRSVEFHQATYGNMGDCGLPDHVAVIQQLVDKYPYIDCNRIGITGFSGGGYAAARGMLMYPDVFKVGVAAAGNHDLRCYPASYGEKYNGLNFGAYENESNAAFAKQLSGKLLLIHGEMDDNVHPCATMQLVDALIKTNKDFDMLMMPNLNHRATFDHPYYWRKLWDYFVKHLLDVEPPKEYCFGEIMPESFPQLFDC